jgi:hypothetical protein
VDAEEAPGRYIEKANGWDAKGVPGVYAAGAPGRAPKEPRRPTLFDHTDDRVEGESLGA